MDRISPGSEGTSPQGGPCCASMAATGVEGGTGLLVRFGGKPRSLPACHGPYYTALHTRCPGRGDVDVAAVGFRCGAVGRRDGAS